MILDRTTTPYVIDGRKVRDLDLLTRIIGPLVEVAHELHDVPDNALTITVRVPGCKSMNLVPRQLADLWSWLSGDTHPTNGVEVRMPTGVAELPRLWVALDVTFMPVATFAAYLDVPVEQALATVQRAERDGLTVTELAGGEMWVEAQGALRRLHGDDWK